MKIRFFLTVALLLPFGASGAVPLQNQADAIQIATFAMGQLEEKGVRGVFEAVAPHWNQTKVSLEAIISDSERKREQWARTYGSNLGFEFIEENRIGNSLLMVSFLEKTEKRGVVWFFTFYRPKDAWILSSCYWNPNYEGLLLRK